MTTEEAFKLLKNQGTKEWVDDSRHDKESEACKVLVAAKYCSSCAYDGRKVKLGRWQEGNQWDYAGRACTECEDFYPSGLQPEYAEDNSGHSDADPGL